MGRRSPSGLAVPLAAGLLGFLVVLAASQREVPARSARRVELADLIGEQDRRVRELRREVRALEERLAGLGLVASGPRREAERLAAAAGASGLAGPGVVVTLDDSDASRSPTGDPNDLLVHERDIQAVVNGLWAAGAEAVAVDGERLRGTSAVRCAGNTLLLHGSLRSPPYRIAAIGDPGSLEARLSSGPGMERLLATVQTFGLGWAVRAGPVRMRAGSALPRIRRAAPEAAA